jgi:tetratricopeptide (TPR) repeat protein
LLELRIAVEQDRSLVPPAGTLAVGWSQLFDDLIVSVPEGSHGSTMLDELAVQARNRGLPELRARCDREAIARNPAVLGPRVREAEATLEALAPNTQSHACDDRDVCKRAIEDHAAALAVSHPNESIAERLRARLELFQGKPEVAEARLALRCGQTTDRAVCLRARVEAAARIEGVTSRLDAAGKDLLAASCLSTVSCADTATWLAVVRENRGDAGSALNLYLRAAREDPTEARWLSLADAASRAGAHAQAAEALDRVAQRRGTDEALRKRIMEERARALASPRLP